MPKTRLKRKENFVYLAVWLLAALLYLLHAMGENGRSSDLLSANDFLSLADALCPYLAIFLINNYILIPRLLSKRRGWLYVFAVALLLICVGIYQYFDFLVEEEERVRILSTSSQGYWKGPNRLIPMPLVHDYVYSILTIGCNLTIFLMFRQVDFDLERQRIITAGSENRLEQLKTQISPHFYMNMLNNIHGLIEVNPAKAQEMVVDMSQLMRYMLYDSALPRVKLSAEVKFLEDYLRIMRQRFPEDKVRITSEFPAPEECNGVEIPPLLFLVFIENAFKHGVSYRRISFVDVRLQRTGNELIFSCENSLSAETPNTSDKGIGLRNIAQRLQLLYGERAHLEIGKTSDAYQIKLTIPLNSSAK